MPRPRRLQASPAGAGRVAFFDASTTSLDALYPRLGERGRVTFARPRRILQSGTGAAPDGQCAGLGR